MSSGFPVSTASNPVFLFLCLYCPLLWLTVNSLMRTPFLRVCVLLVFLPGLSILFTVPSNCRLSEAPRHPSALLPLTYTLLGMVLWTPFRVTRPGNMVSFLVFLGLNRSIVGRFFHTDVYCSFPCVPSATSFLDNPKITCLLEQPDRLLARILLCSQFCMVSLLVPTLRSGSVSLSQFERSKYPIHIFGIDPPLIYFAFLYPRQGINSSYM